MQALQDHQLPFMGLPYRRPYEPIRPHYTRPYHPNDVFAPYRQFFPTNDPFDRHRPTIRPNDLYLGDPARGGLNGTISINPYSHDDAEAVRIFRQVLEDVCLSHQRRKQQLTRRRELHPRWMDVNLTTNQMEAPSMPILSKLRIYA